MVYIGSHTVYLSNEFKRSVKGWYHMMAIAHTCTCTCINFNMDLTIKPVFNVRTSEDNIEKSSK